MGLEQLIPDDLEPDTEEIIKVAPSPWNWVCTLKEQIVVDEVLASGLSPDKLFLSVGLVQKHVDGTIGVIIGDIPPPLEYLGVVWGADVDFSDEGLSTKTFIRTWHMMLIAPGNPFELHWRQQYDMDPKISIEGIERVKKTKEITKHVKSLAALVPRISEILSSRSGRPTGTNAYPDDELRENVNRVEEMAKNRKGMTIAKAASIVFQQDNLDSAYMAYYRAKQYLQGK